MSFRPLFPSRLPGLLFQSAAGGACASVLLLAGCVNPINPLGKFDPTPKVSSVPPPKPAERFAWGISTASYQYEDPAVKPGNPDFFSTDWDVLVARKKAPPRGNALYSWTRFEKDLEALAKIRPTHYRFSIEWARVEPQPGVYNEAAIRGYVAMARRLKALGIEPVVCLWHFTFPGWLYDKENPGRSNWMHPLVRERWKAYVDKMVRAMGPEVKLYAPQNEPNGQITTAYIVAQWPPAMTLAIGHYWEAIDASTGMFRDAAAIVRRLNPKAKIVSVEALPWWQRAPLDPGGLIYNTMIHGNTDHLDRIYDVCDILGINYYYSQAPGPISLLAGPSMRGKKFSMMGWRIDPKGLTKEILRVATRYGKPMMITENGIATSNDAKREWYMRNHIAAVGDAIRQGADVRGYFAWSLADNYEWHYGFKATFGLATMDPATKTRVLKPSARKFSEIIRSHPTVASVMQITPQKSFAPDARH
ncbi:MAG: glycoside hydrolase family 1 protein [Chthoniobacterales bacterium]|nr:glycoside hydrolase family 1 protein [Chthoniobacterales bacterium]